MFFILFSGPFGYATSRQFNYSKFQNESAADSSQYSKSPKDSGLGNETLDLHRSWPLKSSHTKVYRKESNERPLIDLSDENDTGASSAKPSDSHSHSAGEITSLFDSLLTGNNLQYGNLDLPQPLIREHSDPFEINLAYRQVPKTEAEAKSKRTPPAKPKPIVYRRTSIESQHSSDSWQSFSPPKCTGIKLPPEYRKRDNPTPSDTASMHSAYSVPPQKVENLDRTASFHSVGNGPQAPSSPTKLQSNKNVLEDLFLKSRLNGDNKNILRSEDGRNLPRSPGAVPPDPKNKNVDKAFDWLNDALNNFSLKNTGKSGSDPSLGKSRTPAMYDQVPDESEPHSAPYVSNNTASRSYKKGHYPVQYCEVPSELSSHNSFPRYDDVPQFDDPSDVQLPIPPKDIYSPHSTTSTYSEWDDFDSDFDDVDDDLTVTKTQPIDTSAPPLPRRDYKYSGQRETTNGNTANHVTNHVTQDKKDVKPNIFPIVQDGEQLSYTHYFLIPAKGEELVTNDQKATAAVRPFSIDGNQVGQGRHPDYQNLENLHVLPREMCKDPRTKNSSNNSSTSRSKSSNSGSRSWTNDSVDLSQTYPHSSKRQQYNRSLSHNSDSLEASIDAQRDKITSMQEAVIGITDEECHAALCHCQGNVKKAIKHLKTEQLFRLGLAPREQCYRLLEALHWNLELACSTLLDGYKGKVSMESAV